ncbi:autophagy-related protein 16-1-like isoform X1 [Branchiostoma lanceolatum]|uniref:autophagy-related protein 16-1-like isoform X1 n=1 Tax=Branchiostoma lanceolatum TaxID=7740 RepID=UPI00345719AB
MAASGSEEGGWKQTLLLRLRDRNRVQTHFFADVIHAHNKLFESADTLKSQNVQLQLQTERLKQDKLDLEVKVLDTSANSGTGKGEKTQALEQKLFKLQEELTELHRRKGENSQQIIDLNSALQEKEKILTEKENKLLDTETHLEALKAECRNLEQAILEKDALHQALRDEHQALQMTFSALEDKLRKTQAENQELVERWLQQKSRDADKMNFENDQMARKRQAKLQRELAEAAKEPSLPLTDKHGSKKKVHFRKRSESGPRSPENGQPDPTAPSGSPINKIFNSSTSEAPANPGHVGFIESIAGLLAGKKRSSSHDDGFEPQTSAAGAPPRHYVTVTLPSTAVHKADGHDGEVNAVRFSPSGRIVATGGTDRKLKLWEVMNRKLDSKAVLTGSNAGIMSVEFDPQENYILGASNDFASRVWSVADYRLRHTLTGHSGRVLAAKFLGDSSRVVSGSHDRTLKVWDLRSRACIRTIFAGSSCNDLVTSDLSGTNIISGHFDKRIRFWDTRAESSANEITLQGKITSVDLSLDNKYLLSCSRDDSLKLIDLRMNQVTGTFCADGFKVGCDWTRAIFSPDAQYVVAGSSDGSIYIWNITTFRLEKTLKEHNSSVIACSWHPSGVMMVSCDKNKKVTLWSDF